jgi:hypothetical protein
MLNDRKGRYGGDEKASLPDCFREEAGIFSVKGGCLSQGNGERDG